MKTGRIGHKHLTTIFLSVMRLGRLGPVARASFLLAFGIGGVLFTTQQNGGTLGLDHAPSGALLAELADLSGLTLLAANPATHVGADGTTADTTMRDYKILSVSVTRAKLFRACIIKRLFAPNIDDQHLMPDIVCQGRWRDQDVTVHLISRCITSCIVTLEARVI